MGDLPDCPPLPAQPPGAPVLGLDRDDIDFGTVTIGAQRGESVRVRNAGGGGLVLKPPTRMDVRVANPAWQGSFGAPFWSCDPLRGDEPRSGGAFLGEPAYREYCDITVPFQPRVAGEIRAELSVSESGRQPPMTRTVRLRGTGVAARLLIDGMPRPMTCPPTRARLCFDRAHGVTVDPSCPAGSPGGRRSLVLSTTAGAVRVRGTDPMVAPPTMTALRGGYVLVAPASSPPWTVTPGAPVTLTLRHCNPPTDMSTPASIFGLLTDDLCGAYELLIDARAGCAGAGGF